MYYARVQGATNSGHVCTVRTPGAFWSVDLDIYISTISMSHDLRVSSLAAIIVRSTVNRIPGILSNTGFCSNSKLSFFRLVLSNTGHGT